MLRATTLFTSVFVAAILAAGLLVGQESAVQRRVLRTPPSTADDATGARSAATRRPDGDSSSVKGSQQSPGLTREFSRNRPITAAPHHAATGNLAEFGASGPFDYSATGAHLVAAVRDGGGLAVWETAARRRLSRLEDSDRRYSLVAISDDGPWVAAVRQDDPRLIDLWHFDGRHLRVIRAAAGAVRKLEFNGGNQLRVVDAGGRAISYSIPHGVPLERNGDGGGAAVRRPATRTESDRFSAPAAPATRGQTPAARPPVAPEPAAPSIVRDQVMRAAPPEPRIPTTEPPIRPTMPPPASPQLPPRIDNEPEDTVRLPATAAPSAPRSEVPYNPPPAPDGPAFGAPSEPALPASQAPAWNEPDAAAEPYEPSGGASPEAMMEMMRAPTESTTAPGPDLPIGGAAPEQPVEAPESFEAAPQTPVREFRLELNERESDDAAAPAPTAKPTVPESPQANPAPRSEPTRPTSVTVHFATNRNRLAPKDRAWSTYFVGFFSSLPAIVVYVLLVLALAILPWFGKKSWAGAAIVAGLVVLCSMGLLEAYVRSQLRDELSGELYGCRPTDLSYGVCEISVPPPKNRQAGELSRPVSVWIFEAPENPERHFMLREVVEHADKDVFYRSLSAQVGKSDSRAAMVFIHGYNVAFEDAVFRTAQLAVDLKFPGAPIAFCWPSYADPVKYTFDEQNAEVSIPALQEVLADLATRSGVKRVHIIAHSMGNRVLAGALRSMDPQAQSRNREVFRELVLAAPDIDRRVFQSQVLPHIVRNVQHCTLYASSRDRALLLSRCFHNYQRLGETEPELLVATGLDTIDASLVDTSLLGHSYIGDVQSIVSDLQELVVSGKRPFERLGLQLLERNALKYWSIKPEQQIVTEASLRR